MSRWKATKPKTLEQKYPASEPCDCGYCRGNCQHPGLWTVEQAKAAIAAGYGDRMMLRIPPDGSPYKPCLAPALHGREGVVGSAVYRGTGCTFFVDGLCQLHNGPLKPVECRFTHHSRIGTGQQCHEDILTEWASDEGQRVTLQWAADRGLLKPDGLKQLKELTDAK